MLPRMNPAKKYNWHKIADHISHIQFSPHGTTEIEIDGKAICLVLNKDRLMACTQKCPHAGGILADGFVDALGNIVCPIHHYKFSLANGRNVSSEGYFLKIFPVEIRNEAVFVGFEENNPLID